eukprot:6912220-Pyramimonas_sp.AAC.1
MFYSASAPCQRAIESKSQNRPPPLALPGHPQGAPRWHRMAPRRSKMARDPTTRSKMTPIWLSDGPTGP